MSLEENVQWLVDRAKISDLLVRFAQALDTRDFEAYAAMYTSDGMLELPDPLTGEYFSLRQVDLQEAVPKSLGRYTATHHLSTNHQIEVCGDVARSRSYVQSVHVQDSPSTHWTGGGWYDCDYRRTADGWKFVRVRLTAVWLSGQPGAIRPGD